MTVDLESLVFGLVTMFVLYCQGFLQILYRLPQIFSVWNDSHDISFEPFALP